MGALVGVEDLRFRASQGFFKSRKTKLFVQGGGNLPGEDITAVPVHDGDKVEKTSLKTDVGDVRTPYLVWMVNDNIIQEIRIQLMPLGRLAELFPWIDGKETHLSHETPYPFVVYGVSLPS